MGSTKWEVRSGKFAAFCHSVIPFRFRSETSESERNRNVNDMVIIPFLSFRRKIRQRHGYRPFLSFRRKIRQRHGYRPFLPFSVEIR